MPSAGRSQTSASPTALCPARVGGVEGRSFGRTSGPHPSRLRAHLGTLFQAAVEPSPAPLLSTKPQKRKAVEMSPGLMQRTATIGSCPVIYSQPLMAAGKYQPSAVPLASLRPRQRLQGEIQGRPNLRIAPGHSGPQPAALGLQSGYLGVTAPAAPSVMSYSECAAPVSLAAAAVQPAPARGALPAAGTTDQPPPPPPPQTPPPPAPKAPPPPEKEKPRKGRKDKVGRCSCAGHSPGALFSLSSHPHHGLLHFWHRARRARRRCRRW